MNSSFNASPIAKTKSRVFSPNAFKMAKVQGLPDVKYNGATADSKPLNYPMVNNNQILVRSQGRRSSQIVGNEHYIERNINTQKRDYT